jgi:hypothetical protein
MKDETVRIKMLGNRREKEAGKEYDVSAAEANRLTGMGLAVMVAVKPAKEKENVI